MNNRELGSIYETKAREYLIQQGIRIVEMNYRCKQGEVDLIGYDGPCLVFFEVKYRTSNRYGIAAEAVNDKKQRKIAKIAQSYCYENKLPMEAEVRFDCILIDGETWTWMKDAFECYLA